MMNKYQCLERIGEGSFGSVWKAKYIDNDAIVALKLVPKTNQSYADLNALRSECDILKTLNHENVVKALESFETRNEMVLVTEFIDGGNLAFLMSKFPTGLDPPLVKNLTVDLLCALHYLHRQRILHRDLKPQNVLIEKASGKAKLADFGFARNLSLNTQVLTSIKGTPLYMAPELIEERPYDFKADLWSAGGILYEAAFGHPPFPTNSLFKLIQKIRYEQVSWPCDPQIKPEVALLQGLLEKDPKRRFNWIEILNHDYLKDNVKIQECLKMNMEFTSQLTESQELAKEIQRQDKAKKLPGRSQTLIGIAQKYEDQKKKLEKMKKVAAAQQHHQQRRYSDMSHYQTLIKPQPVRRNSDLASYSVNREDEDVTFNNEEWLQFLDRQMKTMDNEGKINSNDLILLMKPLKTTLSSDEVVKKTTTVLALPFVKATQIDALCNAYVSAQVVEHLTKKLSNIQEIKCQEDILLLLTKLCYLENKTLVHKIDFETILPFLNNSCDKVIAYALDILIQLARLRKFKTTNVDFKIAFQAHPKKTLILLCLLPDKKPYAKSLIQNNQIPLLHQNDEKFKLLQDKLLSF